MTPSRSDDARLLTAIAALGRDAGDPDRARDDLSRVVWGGLAEPGDAVAGMLIDALGADDALQAARSARRGSAPPAAAAIPARDWSDALGRWRPRMASSAQESAHSLAIAAARGIRLVTPSDDDWPVLLDDLGPHGPLCLWVRGDPAHLRGARPAVAIVGARAATGYGEHVAAELAADLSQRGAVIVSGGAYGIDGTAHRAALAAGGTTIAVMAGGVERAYPAGHTSLFEQITQAGAVISEVPCGSAPTKWRFLSRNRLIAALTGATVVVEAGVRSGSLNTANHAATLGRPIGAVPGPVTSPSSAGCHRLLREYEARCVTDVGDVLELLDPGTLFAVGDALAGDEVGHGVGRDELVEGDVSARPRTDDTMRVRDALSTRSHRGAQDVARRSGMSVADVETRLGLLLLAGEAERGPAGWRLIRSSAR